MKTNVNLLSGYDNALLAQYNELEPNVRNTHIFDEIGGKAIDGVLKACFYKDGKLIQMYSSDENHVGVIAATRLGKTTSYVIPTILSFARQKVKRSLIISDPKGEVYKYTAEELKKQGYEIKLLNFRNYRKSECWNMLTPIYRKYTAIMNIDDEVKVVKEKDGALYNSFRGKVYKNQKQLDEAIDTITKYELDDVGNDIDTVANVIAPTLSGKDPYWEDTARELLKAFLWAMLEDTQLEKNPITEDTFSFSTMLSIMNTFKDEGTSGSAYNDGGYFSTRPSESRAYSLAKFAILDNAHTTRRCVVSSFNAKVAIFRESAIRLITSCNSFELSELTGDKPVALFINYRDELKVHYKIISMFVQDAYRFLIEEAMKKPNGKLDAPFYFILDEFGNFPAIKDFETTISACAGRNIWFILIIQSYAQLDSVYGENAKIIRDNLNMHVFFGSNNPSTLEEISKECGNMTRISPLSALNGDGREINHYSVETIPLIPKSRLTHFDQGECIITEANCGYVLLSKLERYYKCKEFSSLSQANIDEYDVKVNPSDKKYAYQYIAKSIKRNPFVF